MENSEQFRERLLKIFQEESVDRLQFLSEGIILLEQSPNPNAQLEILESVYREAHSLKGAARAVGLTDVVTVCHTMEFLLAQVKRGALSFSAETTVALRSVIKVVEDLIHSPDEVSAEQLSESILGLEKILSGSAVETQKERLHESAESREDVSPSIDAKKSDIEPSSSTFSAARSSESKTETMRVPVDRLQTLLLKLEELVSIKLSIRSRVTESQKILAMYDEWKREILKIRESQKKVESEREQSFGEYESTEETSVSDEFLHRLSTFMKTLEAETESFSKRVVADEYEFQRLIDSILRHSKTLLMLPFSHITGGMREMVWEIGHEEKKKVDFSIVGEEIEVSRAILEDLRDPIIHLLRNSVTHGLENTKERAKKKKPERGKISITISQLTGGRIEILVEDDGKGVDRDAVRKSAVRSKLIVQEEANTLTDTETLMLIFRSEVSTSQLITDISGRGIGLAIVKEHIDRLKGTISVESEEGRGCRFRLRVPVTLATFRGLLVTLNDEPFVIPSVNVRKTVRYSPAEVVTVENKPMIVVEGLNTSLVPMVSILGLLAGEKKMEQSDLAVVLEKDGTRMAFCVDAIGEVQEFLVKPLGSHIKKARHISGAVIDERGKPVAVINIPELLKSASGVIPEPIVNREPAKEVKRCSLLVVEDSITSRMLLKNILEAEGYDVSTAIDGIDAYTSLRTQKFDLVVSDVEMPRMNGFELTQRIRSEKDLADLPVVLVTALDSREDRERGIDAGANAYIAKSSFDQCNLLSVIEKLL